MKTINMKNIRNSLLLFFIIAALIGLISLSCDETYVWSYVMPEDSGDGLETASAESVGINLSILADMMEDLDRKSRIHGIHSILILKNNKLVFEEYFDGYDFNPANPNNNFRGDFLHFDRNTVHCMHSTTKSFTLALIGIAIDNGFIESDKDKVFKYFSDYDYLKNEEKEKILLEHLLSNTSGLEWNENDVVLTDPENDLSRIWRVEDPIDFILGKPVIAKPGTYFYYSGGNTILLGEIVKKASAKDASDFSGQYLFGPLGITNYRWLYLPNNVVYASGDLYITPRTMMKFGYLFLNDGIWNGNRIISKEWINKSTTLYTSELNPAGYYMFANGYAYCWWLNDYSINNTNIHTYFTAGWGGQAIYVIPALDTVVVFTAGNYTTGDMQDVQELLITYILPAMF